jgi:hypothetical protein
MPYFSKQQIRDLAALNIQEEAVSAQIEALDLILEFERFRSRARRRRTGRRDRLEFSRGKNDSEL